VKTLRNDVGRKKYINIKPCGAAAVIYYWPHINESKKCEACFCLLRWSVSSYARRSNTARVFRSNTYTHTRSRMGMEPCQNVKMRVLYIGDVRGMLLSAHSDLTEMPFPRWKLMKPAAHLPQIVWKFSLLGHKVHLLGISSHEILNFKLFTYLS
jgi:hypothetical protein